MKKLPVSVAILALAIPLAAHAADLPVAPAYKAPAVAPAPYFTWTGCYLGAHAGYSWSKDSYTLDNGGGLVESFSYNPSSFMGGGQVGCQYQWNSFVLGAEGTWSGLNLSQTDTSVLSPPRQRTFKLDEIATGTARLGFAWDRTLFYVKGGYAGARIDTFAVNPLTGVSVDLNNWQSGYTVGGGLEYMPIPNVVLGVEFNYYNFGFDRTGVATDGTTSRFFNTNAEVYSVLGRASYLFNWGGPVVARY
jgi:outer membrane immunogenic protein